MKIDSFQYLLTTSLSSSAPAKNVNITAPKVAKKLTQSVIGGFIVFPAIIPTISSTREAEILVIKALTLEINTSANHN